jgi:hypothetical protein
MKKKLKQIPKTLLLCLIVFFTSCNKDELNEIENQAKTKSSYISFDEFKMHDQVLEAFEKVEQKQKLASTSRLVYLSQYNFSIDTDKILLVQKGDYKSYTFPIYRQIESDKTENLVITEKENVVNVYLSEYTLSELDKDKIENKKYVDLINKTSFVKLENRTEEEHCFNLVSIPVEWNEVGQVTVSMVFAIEVPCPDGGSTGGGGPSDGSGPGSGWGPGDTGGSWGWGWGDPSDGSGPGSGYSGGGGYSNGGYYPSNPVTSGPNPGNNDPSLSLWDENFIITYPILDDKGNIKDLNKLTKNKPDGSKTKIKTRIDQLKSLLLTSLKENGSMFDDDENILAPFNVGPSFTSWANDGQPQYYISLHMHQNNYIAIGSTTPKPTCPVQSDTDVYNFLLLHRQTNNKNTTAILISRLGTFAIRANNRDLANDTYDILSNRDDNTALKEFVKKYDKLVMEPYQATPINDNTILQGYIEFINTYLVNGHPMGIGLYQAFYDSQGNIINWIKL